MLRAAYTKQLVGEGQAHAGISKNLDLKKKSSKVLNGVSRTSVEKYESIANHQCVDNFEYTAVHVVSIRCNAVCTQVPVGSQCKKMALPLPGTGTF